MVLLQFARFYHQNLTRVGYLISPFKSPLIMKYMLKAIDVTCIKCGNNISGPHPATSQQCLYNYTIGAILPVVITQSAPVCLICPQTSATAWAVSAGVTPPTIPGAPYILYVVSPATTFIGGPSVGCFASSTLIAESNGMCAKLSYPLKYSSVCNLIFTQLA